MRLRSLTLGSTGVDYPLGWEAITGQGGTAGTDGPGPLVIFGNSPASNGSDELRAQPNIQRGQWNMYEVEINLGPLGQANGACRIWVNDVLIGWVRGFPLACPALTSHCAVTLPRPPAPASRRSV